MSSEPVEKDAPAKPAETSTTSGVRPATAAAPRVPSPWSRVPTSEELSERAEQLSEGVSRTAVRLGGVMRDGADVVARGVGEGVRQTASALQAPSAELDALYQGVDLPGISIEAPLETLARRLDHEADLWRGVALRALSRAQWSDRVAQVAAIFSLIGAAALTTIAGLHALVGGQFASARIGLLFAGMVLLAAGTIIVAVVSYYNRTSQRQIAREALSRADHAELRLHRLGVVLALKTVDPTRFLEAIYRLERDTSAPMG